MGHNAKYFEQPESFKPERFSGERSMEKQNSYTYIPFSAGPRNCIGQKFAFYEIKSIVSKILRNFEIVLTQESETYPILSAELVLRPESSISFYFKPRVYWIHHSSQFVHIKINIFWYYCNMFKMISHFLDN